ncbi:MAG: DUF2344 domain-containing protein [Clostridia bacterium]|nr:DUF2344 domain-containing protein [Clostridia bacterium]
MVSEEKVNRPCDNTPIRLRFKFRKVGRLRYISHLELVRTVSKAATRAGIPCWFTQGFNPVPKIVFGTPMSVGMESECEFVELRLTESVDPSDALARLNAATPDELTFLDAYYPDNKLTDQIYAEYEVLVRTERDANRLAESFRALLADPDLTCRNLTHGKATERVVGKQTADATVTVTGEHALRLTMILGTSQGEFLNPDYVMIALDQATNFLSGSPLDNTYLIRRLRALDKDRNPFF